MQHFELALSQIDRLISSVRELLEDNYWTPVCDLHDDLAYVIVQLTLLKANLELDAL